jgi:hypothetical protein
MEISVITACGIITTDPAALSLAAVSKNTGSVITMHNKRLTIIVISLKKYQVVADLVFFINREMMFIST